MDVNGAIFPKQHSNAITRNEQKKKYCPIQHQSVIEKNKQNTDFFISNIVSIMSSPSKKSDKNKVHAIKDLLQCSMSSAYCQKRKASTKGGHLIAQVHNTEVKWSIKPCIFQTKKVSKALIQILVEWTINNSNVCESPITHDTLLITDA